MIKVFHVPRTLFRDIPFGFGSGALVAWAKNNRKEYHWVATVETDDLDRAWTLTNSINNHWSENKGVTAITLPTRSSVVGDIFNLNGKEYVIGSVGFEEL